MKPTRLFTILAAAILLISPLLSQAQTLAAIPGGRTFVGTIDNYPVVAHVAITGKQLKGHYFYLKKGIPLDITGTYNQEAGAWKVTESVKGSPTGYFDFSIGEDEILGNWSAKPAMTDPLDVTWSEVELTKYDPAGVTAKAIGGKYVTEHTIESYDGQDAAGNDLVTEHEVKDQMYVRYIGDGQFYFYISVIAANYHTGEVMGLGKMTDATHGESLMSDCKLGFDFSKTGEVSIDEQDCGDYHGARAYFGVTLTRQ